MAFYKDLEDMFSQRAKRCKTEGDSHWAKAKNGEGQYHYGKAKEFYDSAKANQKKADEARKNNSKFR